MPKMRRVFMLISLVAVLACVGSSNCLADNTVPWLTGVFFGGTGLEYELGTGVNSGAGGLNVNGLSLGYQFLSTSADFVETPIGCPEEECPCYEGICGWNFNGTINGGSILMTLFDANNNPLDFTGRITGGAFVGQYCYFNDACGDSYLSEGINFFFTGIWSNNWHSVGVVEIDYCTLISCFPGNTALGITTMTPEPPSIMLLGSGVLGLATAIRLKRGC